MHFRTARLQNGTNVKNGPRPRQRNAAIKTIHYVCESGAIVKQLFCRIGEFQDPSSRQGVGQFGFAPHQWELKLAHYLPPVAQTSLCEQDHSTACHADWKMAGSEASHAGQ